MRRLLLIVAVLALCCPYNFARSSGHSSTSHSKASSTGTKTVHVKEYTRKDGTVVHAHDRSASGTGSAPTGSGTTAHSPVYYNRDHVAEGFTSHATVQRDKHGKIKRNGAAKNAFKREQPCPATGKSTGRCPGYVIDHVRALECGGADAPSNMQWQTAAEGKAKDKTERYCRL